MTTVTFDTLDFTRRLRDAGFNEQQAEVVVRVLAEAQDTLVTKEHFDTRMETMEARINGEMKLIKWMLALVAAVNVLPILKHLFP
ncbi:DUF1640 domain-containing protein [Endothiovibrio diazotrophicus]